MGYKMEFRDGRDPLFLETKKDLLIWLNSNILSMEATADEIGIDPTLEMFGSVYLYELDQSDDVPYVKIFREGSL